MLRVVWASMNDSDRLAHARLLPPASLDRIVTSIVAFTFSLKRYIAAVGTALSRRVTSGAAVAKVIEVGSLAS
jgi:hypothetical protein